MAMTSPVKLADYKIHENPQGINGWLVEGRIYYDAFVLNNKKAKTKGGEDMKEMTELKMVYELVISRANPLDNPRYELLNQAQRKMKDKILNVIRKTNPNYPEMDYDDDVFKYIVQFNDEYCIDAFAKGISFALNFKEQAERFMNKKYDYYCSFSS